VCLVEAESCRNADTCQPRVKLPDLHRGILSHQVDHFAENTQLNHRALDWNTTCLMLSCQEKKRARSSGIYRKRSARRRL
jgi:hypothetical protein